MRKHHNKLFYGKYPYKVEFDLPGAHALWPTTDRNLEDIRNTTSEPKSDRLNELWQIAEIIMDNRKLMKFRIQEKKSIFYCEKDLAHRLIDKFWQYWKGTTEVSSQALSLKENEVICKRLPHNQYQYQVHLKKDTKGKDEISLRLVLMGANGNPLKARTCPPSPPIWPCTRTSFPKFSTRSVLIVNFMTPSSSARVISAGRNPMS